MLITPRYVLIGLGISSPSLPISPLLSSRLPKPARGASEASEEREMPLVVLTLVFLCFRFRRILQADL